MFTPLTFGTADAFFLQLYSEMCFIKYITQTAASVISVDRGIEMCNTVKACEFTALFL